MDIKHLPVVTIIAVLNIEQSIYSFLAGRGEMFQTLFTKQILHSLLGGISKRTQLTI